MGPSSTTTQTRPGNKVSFGTSAGAPERAHSEQTNESGVVTMMNGWGAGWWLVGGLFMVMCMGMMIWMMAGMMSHGQSAQDTRVGRPEPERTLADRLAKGEIDVDEYNRLLDVLDRGSRSTRS